MFTTRDYLTLPPWEALVQMVNDQTYAQLNPLTTSLVSITSLGGRSVEVVIAAARSTSEFNILPVYPDTTFHYDRLDLAAEFKQGVPVNINGYRLPLSTVDLMNDVGARNGIAFDVGDFLHQRLETYTPGAEVVLQAHPESLRWVGSLKLRLVNTIQQDLGLLLKVHEYPNANQYPNGMPGAIQGAYYAMPYDFTPYRDELKNLKPEALPLISCDRLAAILGDVTGDPWQAKAVAVPYNTAFNLVDDELRYRVAYNGPAVTRYTHRTEYNSVLILELNRTLSTGVAGNLLLHYN
jgi:hypothetical protein